MEKEKNWVVYDVTRGEVVTFAERWWANEYWKDLARKRIHSGNGEYMEDWNDTERKLIRKNPKAESKDKLVLWMYNKGEF